MEKLNRYVSDVFQYKDGILFCENLSVTEIKAWLKGRGLKQCTPVFIYSKLKIETNVQNYLNSFKCLKRKARLNYALKANMNPTLVGIMKSLGCSLTLVSGFELKLALKLGFTPEHMVLNGNGKELWEIELAVINGCLLNIDSMFNLQQTITVCRRLQKQTRVLLRLNPDIDPKVHQYNCTGKHGSKFGIQETHLNAVVGELRSEPLIQLVGIHCHLGSTITDIEIFRESASVMLKHFLKLKDQGFTDIKYINLGGGLGIDYTKHAEETTAAPKLSNGGAMPFNIPTPSDLVRVVDEVFGDEDISLILEPGRSIIGNAGILLTSVLGVKPGDQKSGYIIVDGSMTEVIRPALYSAYHHIDLAEPSQCANKQKLLCDVVGPVCESGDFLGKDRYLTTPHEGCLLAVFDVGAYCASMASNYNMRAKPAEVLISGDKIQLIRRPDTLEDILAPYNI